MKVLITGGSGFIGTNLVDFYIEKGAEVLNLDWNPPLKKPQAGLWNEMDIMNAEELKEQFSISHQRMLFISQPARIQMCRMMNGLTSRISTAPRMCWRP